MSTEQLVQLCIEAPVAVLIAILVIVLFAELKRIDAKTKLQDQERAQSDKERAQREEQREQEDKAKFEQQTRLIQQLLDKQNNLPVKVHSKEENEKVAKLNSFLREQIDKLRIDTGANRIGFYYFHNGGYSNTGIPFAKMSLYLESLDSVSAPVMMDYQNMPQQLMPGVVHEIADDGVYYIYDMEAIKEKDNSTYYIYTQRGTKQAFIQGIRDNMKNIYTGFISVEFNTVDVAKPTKQIQLIISKASQRVSGAIQAFGEDALKRSKKEGSDGK